MPCTLNRVLNNPRARAIVGLDFRFLLMAGRYQIRSFMSAARPTNMGFKLALDIPLDRRLLGWVHV
jgi:hypothetical protein